MTKEILEVRNPRLLNITIYVIVGIMAIIATISLPATWIKIAAVIICIAFGLVHAFGFRAANTPVRIAVYFIVQMILALTLMRLAYPGDVFNLFFYVLGLEAVLVLPTRTAVLWIVGFYLADSISMIWDRGTAGIVSVLFNAAAFLMTAVFGYALRQAEIAHRQNQQLLEELRATQRQLQDLAVIEERNRLAREMHDSLGHRLTVAIVQLEGAQRLIPTDPKRAEQIIGTMRDEMKEALADLRRTVAALRTSMVDDRLLQVALADLAQTFQQDTGLITYFSVTADFPTLPKDYRLTFYRAAQEALTNIQRHARAGNAWLQLCADQRLVSLVVDDDGYGMANPHENASGSGLRGIGERAKALEGEFNISNRPGGGTRLTVSAPLPQRRNNP